MKFSIHIDQIHAIEWKLNASEAIAFSFCYGLSAWAELIQTDGEIYYFASRTKAIEEYPILSDKPDTIYRLYKALESKGLIKYRKFSGKDLIQITAKGKMWNSENFPNMVSNSEKNPNELGKKSENDSENFPTYKYTIEDKNTIDKSSEKPLPKFTPPQREEVLAVYAQIFTDSKVKNARAWADWEMGKFFDHYEGNGWQVGIKGKLSPMKNWRSAASRWAKKCIEDGISDKRLPDKYAQTSAAPADFPKQRTLVF